MKQLKTHAKQIAFEKEQDDKQEIKFQKRLDQRTANFYGLDQSVIQDLKTFLSGLDEGNYNQIINLLNLGREVWKKERDEQDETYFETLKMEAK